MYISFFIEIDANKEAKYKEQFLETVNESRQSEKCVIASSEYSALLEGDQKGIVWEIPEEVMEDVSRNLENKWERDALLVIQRNEKLEQWVSECLKDSGQSVEAIMCYGEYVSIAEIARDMQIKAYYEYSMQQNEAQNGVQKMVTYMQQRVVATETADKELKEYIASTENYLKNLQEHATNLDNQLQKYKTFYDENSGTIEYMQKENENYINMYKEILEELNVVRTENLDLKERYEKHKK